MVMTNYMELLAVNQPWNLILFMVIPVGLAEALVATEFFMVFPCVSAVRYFTTYSYVLNASTTVNFAARPAGKYAVIKAIAVITPMYSAMSVNFGRK